MQFLSVISVQVTLRKSLPKRRSDSTRPGSCSRNGPLGCPSPGVRRPRSQVWSREPVRPQSRVCVCVWAGRTSRALSVPRVGLQAQLSCHFLVGTCLETPRVEWEPSTKVAFPRPPPQQLPLQTRVGRAGTLWACRLPFRPPGASEPAFPASSGARLGRAAGGCSGRGPGLRWVETAPG